MWCGEGAPQRRAALGGNVLVSCAWGLWEELCLTIRAKSSESDFGDSASDAIPSIWLYCRFCFLGSVACGLRAVCVAGRIYGLHVT